MASDVETVIKLARDLCETILESDMVAAGRINFIAGPAAALQDAIREYDRDAWNQRQPSDLLALPLWLTEEPSRSEWCSPWAAPVEGGSYVTDGTALLWVAGAVADVPRREPYHMPKTEMVWSGVVNGTGAHRGTLSVAALAETVLNASHARLGEALLSCVLLATWVGPAALAAGDASIEVTWSGHRDPVRFAGAGWRATVMPTLAEPEAEEVAALPVEVRDA